MRSSIATLSVRTAFALSIAAIPTAMSAQTSTSAPAAAEDTILREPRDFSIDALPLDAAALRFSDQAGIQLLMSPLTDTKMQSSPIKGRMPIDQALDMLLAKTPLHWRALGLHTVTIELADSLAPYAQHILDPIRVEGVRKKQHEQMRVDEWDSKVVATLDRYKRYPPLAQHLGLQDIVYVRITVDRSGRIIDSAISHSRGMSVLDAAALELVSRVARLPRLPDEIEGAQYRVVVPIDYFLAAQ